MRLRVYTFFAVFLLVGQVGAAIAVTIITIPPEENMAGLSPVQMTATAACVPVKGTPRIAWELFGTPTFTPTPPDFQPTGDAANGKALFMEVAQCSTCHYVDRSEWYIGPSLQQIGSIAEFKSETLTAEEYLRFTILRPGATINPSIMPGVMPTNYGEKLSEQQVHDLVAYLLTLQ
jgi:mono/diheme cytochrome c family protein